MVRCHFRAILSWLMRDTGFSFMRFYRVLRLGKYAAQRIAEMPIALLTWPAESYKKSVGAGHARDSFASEITVLEVVRTTSVANKTNFFHS